jgi:hypothetical protein
MADVSITAASVVKSAGGKVKVGTAGATITAGQPLYADSSDSGKLKLAKCTSVAESDVVGIALHGASSGQPVSYLEQDDDFVAGGTLTVGQTYVLSATAGGIAPIADLASTNYVTILGVAKTASVLKLRTIKSATAKP